MKKVFMNFEVYWIMVKFEALRVFRRTPVQSYGYFLAVEQSDLSSHTLYNNFPLKNLT